MSYRKVLLCSVAFSLVATPALADPVSIGSLVITGINALLTAGGIAPIVGSTVVIGSITLAGIVGTTVLTAASFGASLLLNSGRKPGQAQSIDPGNARQSFETGSAGQWRAIGRAKIGGVVAFGNTTNLTRYRLIARCKGPIDGVESYFLGNREVTIEPNGDVSSPPFVRPGGSWINIKKKIGDGTETAWPELVSAFPQQWTTDHRLRGVNQTLVRYTSPGVQAANYLKLYGSGYPDCSEVGRWELLYDPRDGVISDISQAIYSGAPTAGQVKRKWSDNGIVACLHILTDQFQFPLSWFDLPFIAEQAGKADAPVAIRGGGTEPRSRCWGTWEEDSIARGDLLNQIFLSTGVEIVYREGNKIGLALIDDNPESEVLFGAKHIINYKLKTGPEGIERPNICKVRYYSPERDYEMAEIPLVKDQAASPQVPLAWSIYPTEIERVGKKETKYDLPFCPSASQAQRIARRLFAMERAESGIATLNLSGIGAWGANCVSFDHPDFGILKVKPKAPRIDDELRTVEIGHQILPVLSQWNPEQDEALPPVDLPDLGFVPDVGRPSPPTAATVVTYPVSGQTVTRVGYANLPAGIAIVEATYRTAGANPGAWSSMTEVAHSNLTSVCHALVVANLAGQQVEARIRHFNSAEDGSNWSPSLVALCNIDNFPPDPPTISAVATIDNNNNPYVAVTVIGPASLNVAGIVKSGGWSGTVDIEPGQKLEMSAPAPNVPTTPGTYTYSWSAKSVSTNGTASTIATASITYVVAPP